MRHVALKVRVESWVRRIRVLLKMLGMMVRGIHHVVEIVSTVGGREMTAGVLVAIVIENWGTAWVLAHHIILISWIKSSRCHIFRIIVGRRWKERGYWGQAAPWRMHGEHLMTCRMRALADLLPDLRRGFWLWHVQVHHHAINHRVLNVSSRFQSVRNVSLAATMRVLPKSDLLRCRVVHKFAASTLFYGLQRANAIPASLPLRVVLFVLLIVIELSNLIVCQSAPLVEFIWWLLLLFKRVLLGDHLFLIILWRAAITLILSLLTDRLRLLIQNITMSFYTRWIIVAEESRHI